jgi:hypothetical protein
MQPRVNAKIKFREGFRPFAPSVLSEEASEWFELEHDSPYMLVVVPVAPHRRRTLTAEDHEKQGLDLLWVHRSEIPAVTHVDYSARVQTVRADLNPRFHALISAFRDETGCPILLNTSFNLRGEPVVCTPSDACRTFLASGMDALVVGNHLIMRPADAEPTGVCPPPPPMLPKPRSEHDLRVFGLGGGAILATLAALQWWFGHPRVSLGLVGASLLLGLPGALAPASLRAVEVQFARVGKVLGHFNGRILLSLIYVLVVTPLGWLRRHLSGDPLEDRRPPLGDHLWRPLESDADDVARYERMF